MQCPKCDEGKIIKITVKTSGQKALLCNYCETIWFKSEEIRDNTGHPIALLRQKEDIEYMIEESEDQDQEHRSAQYPQHK